MVNMYHSFLIHSSGRRILTPCTTREVLVSVLMLMVLIFFELYVVVQSLSRVRLLETPWTAAHQASISITNCRSLLKLMSIESVMPSNHIILCHPLLLLPSTLPNIRSFLSHISYMSLYILSIKYVLSVYHIFVKYFSSLLLNFSHV